MLGRRSDRTRGKERKRLLSLSCTSHYVTRGDDATRTAPITTYAQLTKMTKSIDDDDDGFHESPPLLKNASIRSHHWKQRLNHLRAAFMHIFDFKDSSVTFVSPTTPSDNIRQRLLVIFFTSCVSDNKMQLLVDENPTRCTPSVVIRTQNNNDDDNENDDDNSRAKRLMQAKRQHACHVGRGL